MKGIIHSAHRRSLWAVVAGIAVGTLALGSAAGAATASPGTSAHRFGPGAIGSVAAISGTSMEVQSAQTGQTTVDWTSSTAFTQLASVSLSSITAGDCVTVTGTTSKKKITAKTVSVSQPTSAGTCPSAGGGGAFFRTGSGGSGPPSGFTPPSGSFTHHFSKTAKAPSGGRAFPGAGDIGFGSGKVTKVATGSITIHGISSTSFTSAKASSAKASTKKSKATPKPTTPATTTFSVKVTSSTTYSESEAAAASNLAVGDCVTATGTTATNGTVSATAIDITSTGGATCSAGFGGFARTAGGGAPANAA